MRQRGSEVMTAHWRNWFVVALLLGTTAYAMAEEIALTTYYPSPRGVYQELRTTGNTYLATQSGNVGIGTIDPRKALHIRASGLIDGGSRAGIILENGSGNRFFLNTWDGVNRFSIGRTGVGDDIVVDSAGSVGIGKTPTFSPLSTLEIRARTIPPGFVGPAYPLEIFNQSDTGVAEIDENGTISTRGSVMIGSLTSTGVTLAPGTDPWPLHVGRNVRGGAPQVLVGASDPLDPAQTRAGWIQATQGLVVPPWSGPAPLLLQMNGGNVGINFFGLPGNPPPRRPLDVWGEVVSIGGRFTLTPDQRSDTGPTWHIDNFGNRLRFFTQPNIDTAGTEWMTILPNGNVGIGTPTPGDHRLYVNGDAVVTEGFNTEGDVAEPIDCPGCEAADVVVIDPARDRQLTRATRAYDATVAGVISESPTLHIGGSRSETAKPLALVGQVKCKVTTENGPIQRGDLLVSSSVPGHAMRADPDDVGTGMLLGKALEPLAEGEGTILVLITGG